MKPVRTRFAPSPTGFLHVGGVRTALFAWLLARQSKGQFILRIEDTDQEREVQGSANHIMESLRWLELQWDEGPEVGGPYGPYFQSQRLDSYKPWAEKLIAAGRAYADPYTPAEVETFRKQAQAEKRPFLFRNHRPEQLPAWDGKQALRFKSDPKEYHWHDEVMGDLSSGPEVVDDFIIIKSDGFPTYNFAHIIDDLNMEITNVIRSQEFLSSVPKYLNLYEALAIDRPLLATVPFVMGPDGKKKLSKRDSAKDVLDYAKEGYLPEALVNFMASLGWNDGTEQEIFSIDELITKFHLNRVQRSGARFDEQRLEWMNGHYIRQLNLDDLYARSTQESYKNVWWPKSAWQGEVSGDYRKAVLSLVQERLKHFDELTELTTFFFEDLPVNLELITSNKQLSVLPGDEQHQLLQTATEALDKCEWNETALTECLNHLLESTGQKPAALFSLIRIATTWAPASPMLAPSLAVMGKDLVMRRLGVALEKI